MMLLSAEASGYFPSKGHYCELPTSALSLYCGSAIEACWMHEDKLYVRSDNHEYGAQVNFCPVCGFKAPIQIGPEAFQPGPPAEGIAK